MNVKNHFSDTVMKNVFLHVENVTLKKPHIIYAQNFNTSFCHFYTPILCIYNMCYVKIKIQDNICKATFVSFAGTL